MNTEIIVRTNLPAVREQLRAFGLDFERRVIRSATRSAASVIRKMATQNAPVLKEPRKGRTAGALKSALYIGRDRRVPKGAERQYVSVKAGRASNAPFYWRFLEAGWIPRGPGQKFKGGERRRALERSRAIAGGARKIEKYRFITPGFASGQGAAIQAFYARIAQRVARENAKRGMA